MKLNRPNLQPNDDVDFCSNGLVAIAMATQLCVTIVKYFFFQRKKFRILFVKLALAYKHLSGS